MPFITSIQCPIKAVTINQSILGPPSPLDPPSTPTPTPSCRSHGSALRPQAPTPGLPRWTRHQHRRTIKQAGSSASCGSSRLYPAAAATVPGPGCSMSGRQRGAEALRGMPVGGGWQASGHPGSSHPFNGGWPPTWVRTQGICMDSGVEMCRI